MELLRQRLPGRWGGERKVATPRHGAAGPGPEAEWGRPPAASGARRAFGQWREVETASKASPAVHEAHDAGDAMASAGESRADFF